LRRAYGDQELSKVQVHPDTGDSMHPPMVPNAANKERKGRRMTELYTVSLTGRQEVPPNTSTATGFGTFIWDAATNRAAYNYTVRGLDFGPATGTPPQTASPADDVVSMHYHNQLRGANGSVVFGQINPAQDNDDLRIVRNADQSWTVSGVWETTDPATVSITNFANALNTTAFGADAPLYFNIHSRAIPAGEIRGQLVSAGDIGDNIAGFFDSAYYRSANPDVAAAGVDPLTHYLLFGAREGRDPNALFDTSGYLETYRDVAAAGVDPMLHYLTHGAREGRDPSVWFDSSAYLAAYRDVAAAGVNPMEHFLQFGVHEGRLTFADGVWG
jgi:hypothetical protein